MLNTQYVLFNGSRADKQMSFPSFDKRHTPIIIQSHNSNSQLLCVLRCIRLRIAWYPFAGADAQIATFVSLGLDELPPHPASRAALVFDRVKSEVSAWSQAAALPRRHELIMKQIASNRPSIVTLVEFCPQVSVDIAITLVVSPRVIRNSSVSCSDTISSRIS